MARILYLALADARGHLMRAHILRGLLADRQIAVDIVTTARSGQAFLAGLGTPSELLSEHFAVQFDRRHNMSRRRTDARVAAYLCLPGRCRADLARLGELARGADLVVDDSFHPAMVFAHRRFPVVHVYGENMWRAVLENLDGRGLGLARPYRWAMERLTRRAFGHIIHTLSPAAASHGAERIHLPPIIPPLGSTPARTANARRTAVAYLNPHFKDPAIAAAIERAAARCGYTLYGVAEGFADRPGWRALDANLVDRVAAADLFISGAGMGALGMATRFAVPFVCLLGRQPEQRANVAQLGPLPTARTAEIPIAGDLDICAEVADLTFRCRRSTRPDPRAQIAALHRQWTDAFEHFLARASGRPTDNRERTQRVSSAS